MDEVTYPEWFVITLMVFMFLYGFILAHALNNQHVRFWQSFMDGLALRILWDRNYRNGS